MKTWLVDTGPWVSFLDARDRHHAAVAACLDGFSGQLATTGAVVTEAMHFLSATPEGPRLLAELLTRSRTDVYDLCRPPELIHAANLMADYADTPMDFADATLVLAAEAIGVCDVLTLDRRGFSAFRTRRKRGFRLVLDSV